MRSLVVIALLGCGDTSRPASPPSASHHAGRDHHHDGARVGIHGMVLFGRNHHYLEHIPMFSPPHDEQLVMRATLTDARGKPITGDFSDQGYTIQPTTEFSLDDLVLRRRREFRADVFRGNFEAGGTRIHGDVHVVVDEVLVARNLPGSEPIADGDQEYLLVGEPGDAYLTNYIRRTRGFQQILRVDAIDGPARSPASAHRLRLQSQARVAASTTTTALAGTARLTMKIGPELSCLVAPDFASPCRP
jgi:hypothetical protein